MAKRKSAHLTRTLIEGISSYSPYKGQKLLYQRDYDPSPNVNVDLIAVLDLKRAMTELHKQGELSDQEMLMLSYVMLDGRLSRRDISKMIEKEMGYYVDQRTISRRLESAYWKIQKYLGFEYADSRIFRMVAKKGASKLDIDPKPAPYLLNDEEQDKVITVMERT